MHALLDTPRSPNGGIRGVGGDGDGGGEDDAAGSDVAGGLKAGRRGEQNGMRALGRRVQTEAQDHED